MVVEAYIELDLYFQRTILQIPFNCKGVTQEIGTDVQIVIEMSQIKDIKNITVYNGNVGNAIQHDGTLILIEVVSDPRWHPTFDRPIRNGTCKTSVTFVFDPTRRQLAVRLLPDATNISVVVFRCPWSAQQCRNAFRAHVSDPLSDYKV